MSALPWPGLLAQERRLWRRPTPFCRREISANEHMSAAARAYQLFITKTDKVFLLNGVKFDGVMNGILVEVKDNYRQFMDPKEGVFFDGFVKNGGQALIDQAVRQLKAAQGVKIRWYFSDRVSMEAVQKLFREKEIAGIEFVYKPKP